MITLSDWSSEINSHIHNLHGPGSGKYWDPKVETMPRSELARMRDKKFKTMVHFLYENSPWYHRKFDEMGIKPTDFTGVKDISKGPVTVKEDFAINQIEKPPFGDFQTISMDDWARNGWFIESTGGTTQKPRLFMVSKSDMDVWSYIYARAFWAFGIRPGNILFNATVYGPFPGMWGSHYGAHVIGVPIIPGGGMDSKRRLFFMQECKADTLIAVPSYVMHLAEEARKAGIDPAKDLKIDHVVMMAEPGACVPATKRRIQADWSATTHDYFGHTEAFMGGCLGFSCAEEDAQDQRPVADHISEDMSVVEVVDPDTMEPVNKGDKGITVVTNMFAVSNPAFRYVMGDLIQYTDEKCECGRTFGRAIGGLLGRVDDMLKIRGTVVYPSAIQSVVQTFKEFGNEYQIVLTKAGELDEISVKVEANPGVPHDRWSELSKKLAEEIALVIGLRTTIEITEPGSLSRFTRGDLDAKAKRVKDLRPKVH